MTKWYVFARVSAWGLGFIDFSFKSMKGYGGTFGKLEDPPEWLYYV